VDKAQVTSFLARMDALYLGLQGKPLFRFGVSPTKLNDYLIAARPILYAIDAPPDVVGEAGAGVSARAEDPQSIAEAIDTLQGFPSAERDAMGRRGRDWVMANRDYRVLAARFIDAIAEVRP